MLSVTRRARSAAAAGRRRVRSAAALFACTVAAVVCAGAPPAQADTPPLQHYDITADYVSGLSSGAAEAVQFQVAYSATFKGLAFFGGAPYDCAQDRPTIPGLRTVIRAQVTTMIADPTGAPLLAAQAAAEELKNPRHDPGAIGRHPYPHTASRWRTALPAEPVRRRPAGRAGDPDRPAMYPGGTWHPPPVNLRRYSGEPQRPRRRIRFCRNEYFIRAHIYVRFGILTHSLSALPAFIVRPFPLFW